VPAFHCGVLRISRLQHRAVARTHAAAVPADTERPDLVVIGPMARSAADLTLLLDVIAGPDPLNTGVGYKLALPPPRHNELKNFRILAIDSDPMLRRTRI